MIGIVGDAARLAGVVRVLDNAVQDTALPLAGVDGVGPTSTERDFECDAERDLECDSEREVDARAFVR